MGLLSIFAGTKAAGGSPPPSFQLSEDFDDISTLVGNGWSRQNLSNPPGSGGQANWFQGLSTPFGSQAGAPTAFISANFNNCGTSAPKTISNWLLTPVLTLANGVVFTYYTRTETGQPFQDRMQVRMSLAGASVNVGASETSVGDFTTLIRDINSAYNSSYPDSWTLFTETLSGIGSPTSGRLAFRYFVEDGGPAGSRSDVIGIDTVRVTN